MTMLYERWRRVAAARRGELALREAASGRAWTFSQLLAAGEGCRPGAGGWGYPCGQSAEFVFSVLGLWRTGKGVCPLEVGQALPPLPRPPPWCAHLKFTSATTGEPRWVAFTAAQLQADADQIVATMGLRADWPNLGVISMAHSYGFSNLVLPLVLHGIPLVLAPSALPEAMRRAAVAAEAITLPAVPVLWRAWYEAGAIPGNVRQAISAGAPLSAELERAVFRRSGLKLHNFYGSTECGGIAYDATQTPRAEDSLVGTALGGVRLSVTRNARLLVRSAAVAETYWPEPAATLGAGRFQTSDLVELKQGKVFLRGRATDLINVAGRKLSPETVEQALSSHPGVEDCVVFGTRGPGHGREMVAAVVVGKAREPELRRFLLGRLPAWQVPREWRFVASLAPNARGKTSRTVWRRRYFGDPA